MKKVLVTLLNLIISDSHKLEKVKKWINAHPDSQYYLTTLVPGVVGDATCPFGTFISVSDFYYRIIFGDFKKNKNGKK